VAGGEHHHRRDVSVAQLDEDIDAYGTTLSPEMLAEIDKIRWDIRDPAA
jgi:aryl-alcohol dehydrogenase-like predicted oxidoreductase